jgi:hypothetical protein
MNRIPSRLPLLAVLAASLALPTVAHAAVNSYRFLHVTINTPWQLFLFLLIGVLSPFVLMAVLLWRNALRKPVRPARPSAPPPSSPPKP